MYTYAGGDKIASDVKNKNGMRSPNTMQFDLKLAKGFQVGNTRLFFGVDIYNILDDTYPIDVHFLSGKVNDPEIITAEILDMNIQELILIILG